jgi:hypothetical protein
MYRTHVTPAPRKGVILLVVLALLTLFTIIGISFVLYADAAAKQGRTERDGKVKSVADVDPEECLSLFLDQLIYDARDDESGVYSSMRGYSLSRSMYGFNYNWADVTFPNAGMTPDLIVQNANATPFNGTGRMHYTTPGVTLDGNTVDDWTLVNYMFYASDGFLRDPERYGIRLDPTTGKPAGLRAPGAADNRGPWLGGFNVSYTYPDLNNFFLAAVDGNGNLLAGSFHREWLFGRLDDPNNPNWTNQVGKYLTLTPRPKENPGFPYPGDRGGHVKNLIGYPGGNDSIWMDIGAPVMTAPDGRKYKMLVAPLILDLDGRVNLNVHGNVHGAQNTPLSNQGLGACEVNLAQVLGTVLTPPSSPNEWQNLFAGRTQPTIWGRYGPGGIPVATQVAAPASNLLPALPTVGHQYAPFDLKGTAGGPVTMPSANPNAAGFLSCFPSYPTGYNNGSQTDRQSHALLYNPFAPLAPWLDTTQKPPAAMPYYNRRFRTSNMERLLRWGDTGFEALTADLERLLPSNLNDPNDPVSCWVRRAYLTTDSGDRNVPGVAPYVWDPTQAPYGLSAAQIAAGAFDQAPVPTATPLFPDPTNQTVRGTLPPGSDFTSDWRRAAVGASMPVLQRVDLNRKLTAYPDPIANPRYDINTTAAQFLQAQTDRQQLARDIYSCLLSVTGVTPVANPANPTDLELQPRRWLAQLAANIVDYIDDDDISTPFNFYPDPGTTVPNFAIDTMITTTTKYTFNSGVGNPTDIPEENPRYWVFGTELPRIVVNEVLTEYTPAATPQANGAYFNYVWVELYNPMDPAVANAPNPNTTDGAPVPLMMAGVTGNQQIGGTVSIPANTNAYATYQLMIADQLMPLTQDNFNVVGRPVNVRGATAVNQFSEFGNITQMNGQGGALAASMSPQSFLIVKPQDGNEVNNSISVNFIPPTTPTMTTGGLRYRTMYTDANGTRTPDDRTNGIAVILRRLANPHIPYNGTVSSPWYNPYVTVDYTGNVPLSDATKSPLTSVGRVQPYAGLKLPADGTAPNTNSLVQPQQSGLVPPPKTNHTFGRPNFPLPPNNKYDWLAHLDRPLTSPMELLHVSQFQPHQLTQKFMLQDDPQGTTNPTRFQHAPLTTWYNDATRLARLFELVQVGDRVTGNAPNGRATGKININSIWSYDPAVTAPVFMALCDPQTSLPFRNDFRTPDVTKAWNNLIKTRSPNLDPTGSFNVPGPNDRPFQGIATGLSATGNQYPVGQGINDTLLRAAAANGNATSARLFDYKPAGNVDNPFLKTQLVRKIFNNVTTRSNVFAVWLTVGFFEVTDDTVRPVKLGAEMNASEGRYVRHRMFAIVDRSVLANNPYPSVQAASPVPGSRAPLRPNSDTSGVILHWAIID